MGTEFFWEWREQSGGKSVGCPEDQGPVVFPAGPRGFSGGALRSRTENSTSLRTTDPRVFAMP